jgi:hypothetical protein
MYSICEYSNHESSVVCAKICRYISVLLVHLWRRKPCTWFKSTPYFYSNWKWVISENILLEMPNRHEFVSELGTIDDLGSKSTEYVFGFKKLIGLLGSASCNASCSSNIPATSVIHSSVRGCQIIFFINCIFDYHIFIFHWCRLHYLILVYKLKGWYGLYTGDRRPPRIPLSFSAHGIL